MILCSAACTTHRQGVNQARQVTTKSQNKIKSGTVLPFLSFRRSEKKSKNYLSAGSPDGCAIDIRSKRRQVGSATGRIGDKQNGDTPKRRQPERRQLRSYRRQIVKMAKKQQVKTATTIEEEEGREKKRREERKRGGKKKNH